ncbi:GNAT family N-acetyltransferase [Muriicola sp. E247]|uniref:GNAT family N-acetyltransferase n=1 Tax=Muriicola sp. E247 TaxID=3242730 RepID=UPI00352509F1
MIRPAKIGEIHQIMCVTKACAHHMLAQGIEQWNDHYPSQEIFNNDIERGELFVKEIDGQIVGYICITTVMDEEYLPVKWLTPNEINIYVHRLAIHPDFQGKGYARQLMDKAEKMAREENYTSVRLDTFSKNERNQRFYEARGYKKLEPIYFPKQSPYPFYCYELIL